MGLTERHWFENEEPVLSERQLEEIVDSINESYERGYQKGYQKGYSDRDKQIVMCKNCKHLVDHKYFLECKKRNEARDYDWFCADGKRKESD